MTDFKVLGLYVNGEAGVEAIARLSGWSPGMVRAALRTRERINNGEFDAILEQTRQSLRNPPPRPAASRASGGKSPGTLDAGQRAELSAFSRGYRLAREHPGLSPSEIAPALGFTVNLYPGTAMPGSTPEWTVTGRSIGGPAGGLIAVAAGLGKAAREWVVAHEIGHCLNVAEGLTDGEAERACDSFAIGLAGPRPEGLK